MCDTIHLMYACNAAGEFFLMCRSCMCCFGGWNSTTTTYGVHHWLLVVVIEGLMLMILFGCLHVQADLCSCVGLWRWGERDVKRRGITKGIVPVT